MSSQLPNELLNAILVYNMRIPRHVFLDTTEPSHSPFSNTELSSSRFLLVCKRWMHISMPVLFTQVVIRSSAQAWSLFRALEQHPELGCLIRFLRIEGHWPTSNTSRLMSNVEELCLGIDSQLTNSNSTAGLDRLLRVVNPKHLCFLDASTALAYYKCEALYKVISKHIPRWHNLTCITIPRWSLVFDHWISTTIWDAVRAVRSFEELRIPLTEEDDYDPIDAEQFGRRFERFLTFPSLERIVFLSDQLLNFDTRIFSSTPEELVDRIYARRHDGTLLHGLRELRAMREGPAHLSTEAIDRAPLVLQQQIWQMIISFAVHEGGPATYTEAAWFSDRCSHQVCRSLLLTNRFLCENLLCVIVNKIYLEDPLMGDAIATILQSRPHLQPLIRKIDVGEYCHASQAITIISLAAELRRLDITDGAASTVSLLEAASKSCLQLEVLKLQEDLFRRRRSSDSKDVWNMKADEIMLGFRHLTKLSWGLRTAVLEWDKDAPAQNIRGLELLEELEFTQDANEAFPLWLSRLRLPRLRKLQLIRRRWIHSGAKGKEILPIVVKGGIVAFFKKHGARLEELQLESAKLASSHLTAMISLQRLTLGHLEPDVVKIIAQARPPAVKCIYVNWPNNASGPQNSRPILWKELHIGILAGGFPALEEIRYTNAGYPLWPSAETASTGSVSWAQHISDELKRKRGVTLRDAEGKMHRPRLAADTVLRRSSRTRPVKTSEA